MFSSQSKRNLFSFKDIRCNDYHTETVRNNGLEYLYIISTVSNGKRILERLSSLSSELYYTHLRVIETYVTINLKFMNPNIFLIWHNRLGHLRSIIMRIIIENSHGHPLKNLKILQSNELLYDAYSQSKLIIRTLLAKLGIESSVF